MRDNIKSVIVTACLATLPMLAFAHEAAPATSSGLMIGKATDPFWFSIGGSMKIDERMFFGNTDKTITANNTAGTYKSGAFIRSLGLNFEGGLGKDFSYNIELNYSPSDSKIKADDAYVTYWGFRDYAPNLNVSVGQVAPGFCIECAMSSKWTPFMERSMATTTFGPELGLGVSVNTFDNNYSATFTGTQQPRSGSDIKDVSGSKIANNGLWQGSTRLTYAPIAEAGKVLQVGLSAHIEEFSNTGLELNPTPEMSTPASTSLLSTTSILANGSKRLIVARNQKTVDLEVAGVHGPWSGQVEYQKTFITRGKLITTGKSQGSNLRFHGYHAQVAYVLTGESRPHKKSNGTFGQIKPQSPKGAWEVAARYSVIDLNNKDIFGGTAKNTTASISWYANNNVRVIGEYVFSKQKRKFSNYTDRRHVNGLGARIQAVF